MSFKQYPTIVFLLFITIGFGQKKESEIKVTYEVFIDFGIPAGATAQLAINPMESYYIEEKSLPGQKFRSENKVKIYNGSKIELEVYTKSSLKDTLFMRKVLDKTTYLIPEKKITSNWKIFESETDTILGYVCHKATNTFRGREYTVWFTKELPVPFGPWKLNGLPGLILDAQDSKEQVLFKARKIESLAVDDVILESQKAFFNYDHRVSLKEYLDIYDEYMQHKVKLIMSKFPRGSIKDSKRHTERSGRELSYEWE